MRVVMVQRMKKLTTNEQKEKGDLGLGRTIKEEKDQKESILDKTKENILQPILHIEMESFGGNIRWNIPS